jgi:hypothetical protein
MSAYQAARAAEILGLESLPDRLTVKEIAVLQVHDEGLPKPSLSYHGAMAGFLRALQRATIADTWCKAMQGAIDAGELRQTDGKITATEFKRWLDVQGDPPSLLIQSWFALHAREPKAPESMGPHPEDKERRRWTPEKLAELRAFRDEHGTKAAAEKFGISTSWVRQLLPTKKSRRKPDRPKLETIWNDALRQRKT